jgi:hypothetical protein
VLQRTEPFVDVNKIPIIKKAVKPISEQESNESRTVWKEVTAGLRLVNQIQLDVKLLMKIDLQAE